MFAKFVSRAMAAVVVVLAVAIGSRVAAEQLTPLVPTLIVAVSLGVIYALVFGRFRR